MLEVAATVVGLLVAGRVVVGLTGTVRWAPTGDPQLVAALAAVRPRRPCRTACAVVGRASGQVRVAVNRCDARDVFEVGSVTKALTGLLLADAVDRGELTPDTRRRRTGVERYSNFGAALAGHAVARRAGSDYPAVLAERITGPLGMTATSCEPGRPRRPGRGPLGTWAQPWRPVAYAPAGGVTSTIDDLVRLCRALLDGTCPGRGALEQGLFWQIHTVSTGFRRIWHNGQTGGFAAYLAVYPEAGTAVVVLADRADARYTERVASACIQVART